MRKTVVFFLSCMVVILLVSCSKNDPILSEKDIESVSQEISSADFLKQKTLQDNGKSFGLSSRISCDGSRIYIDDRYIDLSTSLSQINCNKPGCSHEENDESCEGRKYLEMNSYTYKDGGYYYTKGNQFFFCKDGKDELLLKNDYETEITKKNWGNRSKDLSRFIFLDDDNVIIFGMGNYAFFFNLNSRIQGDIIVIGEAVSFFYGSAVNKNKIVVSNSDNEMFTIENKM